VENNPTEYPNWFKQDAIYYFMLMMKPFVNRHDLNFLQIGTYTGDCSKWLLDNVLTKPGSKLVDVDTWEGSEESVHKKMDFSDVERVYDEKVSSYSNVIKYKGTSESFLSTAEDHAFDFIYIDGDHTADGVYKDASQSFRTLKVGGLMGFDDYLWKHDSKDPILEPKMGINKFMKEYSDRILVHIVHTQVWLTKVKD
jgi:predicted O-methyltransferase YrrM